MTKIGILASGNGTNLQAIIDAVNNGELPVEIAVVLSDKKDAYALTRAKENNISTAVITKEEFPEREEFDKEAVRVLNEHGVELVVLAGFMRLITDNFLNAFPRGIINIHPSLLPSFPGLNVQKKALEHGVKFSGCTVHFVDGGLDNGPIIIQAAVKVLEGDSVETLSERILTQEHKIYPEAIKLITEGKIEIKGRRVIIKE